MRPLKYKKVVSFLFRNKMSNKAKLLRQHFEKGVQQVRPLELIVQGQVLSEQESKQLNNNLNSLDVQLNDILTTIELLTKQYGNNETSAKQRLWECKLLDLSLRNNLLNLHFGKNAYSLQNQNIATLEDALHAGEELSLKTPDLTPIYRTARSHIEETGASTLFLALGTLLWIDADTHKEHKAPILLMPIELVKLKGKDSYAIRKREDDTILNITLLEMLKVEFDIRVEGVNPLPHDEQGIDVSLIFHRFEEAISEKEGWSVCEDAIVGIFSFAKFVMWNDIHTNAAIMGSNPIIRSLIEGRLVVENSTEEVDMRANDAVVSPATYLLPLDADSSQIAAVIAADMGQSLILNGPPGTGKSQSITNIIANMLYKGKRVLFVAQKKAALDVVKNRLGQIGLSPFCLELHSNKIDKKCFLAQVQEALDIELDKTATNFEKVADELLYERQKICSHIEALHHKRESGYSLYDYIEQALALADGSPIAIPENLLKGKETVSIDEILDMVTTLDANTKLLVCHPSEHPLRGILPIKANNTGTLSYVRKEPLGDILKTIPSTLQQLKQQIERNSKMAYFSRTTRQYIEGDYKFKKLLQSAVIDDTLLDNIDELIVAVDRWIANIHLLPEWQGYAQAAMRLNEIGLSEVVARYVARESAEQLRNAVKAGYFAAEAQRIISSEAPLSEYNGVQLEAIVEKYNTLHREFQLISRQELVCRLSARVNQVLKDQNMATELTLLRKRIGNKGRGISIRSMIDQMPNLLGKLCPVMLMSPQSVAQYINVAQEPFDLVIFDEASQIQTCDAVGAIARANSAIIVGDTKQMPPTNFFAISQNEDADIDDMESILDDCIALSLPLRTLRWHYRSNHEDLISFSNRRYYDNSLITFPSADDCCSHITHQHIDGYYDMGRSRTNKAEAEAIVAEVLQRLKTAPEKSIGVVAFSIQQSNLIEDLMSEAFAANPDLERLNANSTEPLFIKNLENVQGDERDVILLSIGYGPDKEGKVSMNFGPLNKAGGGRRLNVAITRARYEMKVFSTLRSEDIDLRRTQADGVLDLKVFLQFAEDRTRYDKESDIGQSSVIAKQLAHWLQSLGYEVVCNVGASTCKIDVAVLESELKDRYQLGIVINGANHYKLDTTRDREIVYPKVLQHLGWKLYRANVVDWFKNSEFVKAEILQILNS